VERETFPQLLAAGAVVSGFVDSSYWRDLGKPSDFIAGSADLVMGIAPTKALPGPVGTSLVLPGASVAADVVLDGGTTVGAGVVIEAGARVEASVLFDGARIGAATVICNSVIGRNAVIGSRVNMCDAVIGDGADIGDDVELLSGARVWPLVTLPAGSVRFSADG
jgi:mannose-1-phosphate guanylyltransferase